jgi:hypothetical protein
MKWMILIGTVVFMAGCCCTTQVVEYRRTIYPVVEPVLVYPYSQGPIDVTTTTIDYY